jgi:hypothetical protein
MDLGQPVQPANLKRILQMLRPPPRQNEDQIETNFAVPTALVGSLPKIGGTMHALPRYGAGFHRRHCRPPLDLHQDHPPPNDPIAFGEQKYDRQSIAPVPTA